MRIHHLFYLFHVLRHNLFHLLHFPVCTASSTSSFSTFIGRICEKLRKTNSVIIIIFLFLNTVTDRRILRNHCCSLRENRLERLWSRAFDWCRGSNIH